MSTGTWAYWLLAHWLLEANVPSSQCVTHQLGSLAILQNMIYLSVFLTFVKIIGYYSNLWQTILFLGCFSSNFSKSCETGS